MKLVVPNFTSTFRNSSIQTSPLHHQTVTPSLTMSSPSQALLPTRHLPLITSLAASVLPVSLILKYRWNNRFGLDHLHLLLLQLIFCILATRLLPQKPARASGPDSPQLASRTSSRVQPRSSNPTKPPKQPTSVQDELHQQTVKTLLEVVEPALLPKNETQAAQSSATLADWQPIFSDVSPSNHVSQHPTIRSLYAVRMIFDGVEVERVVRCLREKKQWQWDKMCECGGDLGGNVSWVRLKGSWPIKLYTPAKFNRSLNLDTLPLQPKEMVMYSTSVRLSPTDPLRVLFASTTTTHPLKKSDVSVKYAGYLVEPAPDTESSSQLTLIVDLSGFGSLPTFVIKLILTKYIPSSMKTVYALARNLPAPTSSDQALLPALWDPSESSSESGTPDKTEDPLRELVGQLKQLLITLSALHRPPAQSPSSTNSWSDRAWFWAGSVGLMMSSGIALRIIQRARNQKNLR
ncbi:hypothetical protein CROQUDRAFT_132328 [Cronartium quercuum f. sp. fusiforme G11]|uniref:START domain-containing protein n=1 Tax=Cronartium quercuum f. sp. fusiforme G11 TaxID=708437 RepID=A0A9P6NLE9_9BASI|nr:hypothetical protein CROQUDRAFT_132328 [Cronartium quercuum f. sp. fusiforme G11]